MGLEEHLSLYADEGTLDSSGCFTIDRAKALRKLADFTLEHWLEIFFTLGAWLDHDNHSPVEFLFQARRLIVRRQSTSLSAEQLQHLEDYLLAGGVHKGLSLLALTQHLWCQKGDLAIEAQGLRRLWQNGKALTQPGGGDGGLQIELIHRQIKADSTESVEFLSKYLCWTSFDWTFNGLAKAPSAGTPRTLMMLNTPPVNLAVVPGVVVSRPDWDFQMIAQWEPASSTTVVVEGVAYPLSKPLLEGFKCVVFCPQVQRSITRTDAMVSRAQRQVWTEALDLLLEAFLGKAHFWKNDHFLTQHSAAFCRTLWPRLEKSGCLAAAQRLVNSVPNEIGNQLLQARLLMREQKFGSVIELLSGLHNVDFTEEELRYLSLVEDEFSLLFPPLPSGREELYDLVSEFEHQVRHLQNFPRILQAYFLVLGRRSEELGDFTLAERLYLDSYFRPRGRSTVTASYLQPDSLMDKSNLGIPFWLEKIDFQGEYLEGLLSVLSLAQARQSSQRNALEFLDLKLARNMPEDLLAPWRLLSLEAWRLERRHSQREWYKWLLMSRQKGWKPSFPPLSHDGTYKLPKYRIGHSPEARLAELRSRTVYLEYANLACRLAERTAQWDQVARFQNVKSELAEVFQSYQVLEEKEHLWEMGRIAIELGERDLASDFLQRAICRVPAGDFSRLPLLVDLAILEPHRAASVINGLVRVLQIEEQTVGTTLERRLDKCLWPFPVELPSRVRRLAWELDSAEELRAYRIAQVLFGKILGTNWSDASEQDWVNDAIRILTG